jgi:prepilin-type N-terminal cleavage/methylation domain-containing protein
MNTKSKNSKSGFSLIEILIVIAIIGILAGIILVNVSIAREKAKIAKARMEIKQIYNAFIKFDADTEQWPGRRKSNQIECPGTYPNEICFDGCDYGLSDCRAGLICDDPDTPYRNWKGPYIIREENLIDPWGHEYFFDTDYYVDGKCVAVIGSYGPNGVGRNLYDADDIVYVLPTE